MLTAGRQIAAHRHTRRPIRSFALAPAPAMVLLMTMLAAPLAAQPVVRQVLPNPVPNSFGFGTAMDVDGDTLVVGAPEIGSAGIQRGVVSVFTNVGGT